MPSALRDSLSLAEVRAAYRNNQNILRLFRDATGQSTNDPLAILTSYDLQAGSYIGLLGDPAFASVHENYAAALAAVLDPLQPTSLLEAGVGEATTLLAAVRHMRNSADIPVLGFDISWSRIHLGWQHWQAHSNRPVRLFVGELEAIPLPDQSVDVVFTSHAVEPNHGRERIILRELGRIAGRFVVLCEPGYELASPEAQRYMESHGYCRGLRTIAEEEGFRVRDHRLLEVCKNPMNPSAVLVLEKQIAAEAPARPKYACPSCRTDLVLSEGALVCDKEGLVFPVLRWLPCLCRANGIIASHYLGSPPAA